LRDFYSSGVDKRIICAIIMADFVAALGSASLIGFRALHLHRAFAVVDLQLRVRFGLCW